MTPEFRQKFLENRDETGRYLIYSIRTGRTYFIEPIGDGRGGDWGSYNPGTGKIEHKKGDGKYTGSVKASESIITEENFTVIHEVGVGESVRSYIDELDATYPNKEVK